MTNISRVIGDASQERQAEALLLVQTLAGQLGDADYALAMSACTTLLAFVIYQTEVETGKDLLAVVLDRLQLAVAAYKEEETE